MIEELIPKGRKMMKENDRISDDELVELEKLLSEDPEETDASEEKPKEQNKLAAEETEEEVKPKKKMKKWKKALLIFFLSLLGLIVVGALVFVLYVNHLLNQITPYDPANDATVSSSEAEQIILDDEENMIIDEEDEESASIPDLPDLDTENTVSGELTPDVVVTNGDHILNILLVGQDRREGQGRQRSDSMILVTFNKSKNTITLTSFMRDSHVTIPGYKSNKLNAAYAFGGMKLLNETLYQNFGVVVDGDVEVDFFKFKDLINKLGGVDINLTKKEATYVNAAVRTHHVEAGMNRLNGDQALAYARLREIDNDYNRTKRQRTVIESLIQRYKSKSVTEMLSLLEEILPLVVTNMEKGEIVDYLIDFAPMLAGATVNTMQIPAHGTFTGGKARVRPGLAAWFQYNIDFNENRRLLNEIFAE